MYIAAEQSLAILCIEIAMLDTGAWTTAAQTLVASGGVVSSAINSAFVAL